MFLLVLKPLLQSIDLLTAKKEDLTFDAPFELTATRNDCWCPPFYPRTWLLKGSADIHAFLAWFDITFKCTHKKVSFSTGPHAKYTHWKYVFSWVITLGPRP